MVSAEAVPVMESGAVRWIQPHPVWALSVNDRLSVPARPSYVWNNVNRLMNAMDTSY